MRSLIVTPSHVIAMARMRKKADLPEKNCAECGRPFTWRRKWARDWDQVQFCSRACKSAHGRAGSP